MKYYDKMHVFDKVLIAQCWERTGKGRPLEARWVDIDKGTRYRSRWVAKQYKRSDSEECFAATPPIEALLGTDFTHREQSQQESIGGRRLSSAFFYAPVQHEIYVELCEETKKAVEDNNLCAKLRVSMYGTKRRRSKLAKESSRNDGHTRFHKASPVLFCHLQRRNVLCTEMTLSFQENQWTWFGCETSWSPRRKSTLHNTQ